MIRVLLAVLLLVLVGGTVFLAVRPGQEVTSATNPSVTITCDGSTGVDADHCQSWGDEVLALGPPSHTFEFEDVNRIHLSKPMFGFGSPCQVEYFLERYGDESAWTDEIACAGD